jgi:hypothetical protein
VLGFVVVEEVVTRIIADFVYLFLLIDHSYHG